MKITGYRVNINKNNKKYREVRYTVPDQFPLTIVSIQPGNELGWKMHKNQQFIQIKQGRAKLIIDDDKPYLLRDDNIVVIPSDSRYNIFNVSKRDNLKINVLY